MRWNQGQKMTELLAGIDIGSTTTKVAVAVPGNGELVYSDYRRHNAKQAQSVRAVFQELRQRFPEAKFRVCLTGSGAKILAESMKLPFIQEVVANSVAICKLYETAGTAIELGGQDAKIVFFRQEEKTGQLQAADMRMNGSCAGGTGAFIDEIAP